MPPPSPKGQEEFPLSLRDTKKQISHLPGTVRALGAWEFLPSPLPGSWDPNLLLSTATRPGSHMASTTLESLDLGLKLGAPPAKAAGSAQPKACVPGEDTKAQREDRPPKGPSPAFPRPLCQLSH